MKELKKKNLHEEQMLNAENKFKQHGLIFDKKPKSTNKPIDEIVQNNNSNFGPTMKPK